MSDKAKLKAIWSEGSELTKEADVMYAEYWGRTPHGKKANPKPPLPCKLTANVPWRGYTKGAEVMLTTERELAGALPYADAGVLTLEGYAGGQHYGLRRDAIVQRLKAMAAELKALGNAPLARGVLKIARIVERTAGYASSQWRDLEKELDFEMLGSATETTQHEPELAQVTREHQALSLLAAGITCKQDIADRLDVNVRTLGRWKTFTIAWKAHCAKEGRKGLIDEHGNVDAIVD